MVIFLSAIPLSAAPDAEVALRSVANISRLAIGPGCTDPDTSSPWVFAPPPAAYFQGGTPSQKMLVRVWHYGWALRALPRNSPELKTIRSTLLDFMNRQQSYRHEELTSSNHQLWSAALAAAYLYAVADGGTLTRVSENTTRETQVRDAARRWWADELALYQAIYTNDEIAARDDLHRLLRGDPPKRARNCSADRYSTSSFVMQALKAKRVPRLGQPVGGGDPLPKLYEALSVARWRQSDADRR